MLPHIVQNILTQKVNNLGHQVHFLFKTVFCSDYNCNVHFLQSKLAESTGFQSTLKHCEASTLTESITEPKVTVPHSQK